MSSISPIPVAASKPKKLGITLDSTKPKQEQDDEPSMYEPKLVDADDQAGTPHVQIIRTLEAQCHAWNDGNIQRYMEGYAEDAIYISHSLKKVTKSSGTEANVCLHGRGQIEAVFRDVMERSLKRRGGLAYQQIQIQYATVERASVIGRYTFFLTEANEPIDSGVFTLDMARESTPTALWKIKMEHSTSSVV